MSDAATSTVVGGSPQWSTGTRRAATSSSTAARSITSRPDHDVEALGHNCADVTLARACPVDGNPAIIPSVVPYDRVVVHACKSPAQRSVAAKSARKARSAIVELRRTDCSVCAPRHCLSVSCTRGRDHSRTFAPVASPHTYPCRTIR